MAAFPSNPTTGQTFTTSNGQVFTFTSYGTWKSTAASGGTSLPTNAAGLLRNNGTGTLTWGSTTWTTAGRPASPFTGQSGYNSTLAYTEVWTGTTWVQIGGAGATTWTTSTRPSSPTAGQSGYNSTLGAFEYYTGSTWAQLNVVSSAFNSVALTARTTPVRNWTSICSSSSGQKQYACVSGTGGGIYASTDYGVTWTITSAPTTSVQWISIACSASGATVLAVAPGATANVYLSTDSGSTWTQQTGAATTQANVASVSTDGSLMAVLDGSSGLYLRGVFGSSSWQSYPKTPVSSWTSMAMTGDGNTILLAGNNDYLWKLPYPYSAYSQVISDATRSYSNILISRDNSVMIAGSNGTTSPAYVSRNGGDTWETLPQPITPYASSKTGKYMLGRFNAGSGYAAFSEDYGASWVAGANGASITNAVFNQFTVMQGGVPAACMSDDASHVSILVQTASGGSNVKIFTN